MGDQVAGLGFVVEGEGQLLQMVERPAPHLRLDVDAEQVAPINHHGGQSGIGQVDQQQDGGGEEDHAPDHGAAEIEREKPAMGPVIGKEATKHGVFYAGRAPSESWRHVSNTRRCRVSGLLICLAYRAVQHYGSLTKRLFGAAA